MQGYLINIEQATVDNKYFRRVLFTSQHMQLVVMAINPQEEIGTEVHAHVDQFFRVEAGEGSLVMNGESKPIGENDAFIVPAGTEHNVINTSETKWLKVYTIYTPPQHPESTLHRNKTEAEVAEKKN